MKSPINHSLQRLLPIFLGGLLFFSCTKVDKMELNKGDQPLVLYADKQVLTLEERNRTSDAINFNWTAGTNKGTNASISYLFRIDKQGSNFAQAMTSDMGKGTLSKKYTVQQFNELLLNHWHLTPGVEATLEAKVVASVTNHPELADSSAIILIKVTPYQPVSTTLYIIGDAAPNGWNAGQATPLIASLTDAGKFSWQGPLRPGGFKFITQLGQFLPSYNKGADDTRLVYRTLDAQPDDKFVITTPGVYKMTVSLLDLTISFTIADLPPYTRLWMLGDAVPTGWNINAPSEMRVDSSDLFIFTYNETLTAGEFKIPVATGNFATDYYMPLTNHQPLNETGAQLVPGGNPDNKWQVTTPGPYKIKLDTRDNKIYIKPFTAYTQVWMVGDATPVGWNINAPQVMTPDPVDPYVFSYTGPMSAGEFKLPLATGDWGCDYFMPVLNGSGAGSTQMKFIAGGSPDFKWRITEAGNYKISINQLYETISIVKL